MYTFDFLRKNIFKNSDFINYLSKLVKSDDNNSLQILTKKFVQDIDNDIKLGILNEDIKIRKINNYEKYLSILGLEDDIPEEGIYIKNRPNFNGTFIFTMLGCAISDGSSNSDSIKNSIIEMLQKPTISETYDIYLEIFPKFCLEVVYGLDGANTACKNLIGQIEIVDLIFGDKSITNEIKS